MTTGRRAARGGRRVRRILGTGLVLAVLLDGCGTGPVPPLPASAPAGLPNHGATRTATPRPSERDTAGAVGLIAAAGDLGHERFWRVGEDGQWVLVEPPQTGVFGIAGSVDGRIAVTHPEGWLSVSAPVTATTRRLEWRIVTPRPPGGEIVRPLGFASWSRDAARIAVDWVDFGAGRPYRILVVDPADGRATVADLPFGAVGGAPGWVGDDTLLVVGRDQLDRRRLARVDLAGNRARLTSLPIALLAVSPDGQTAAWLDDTRAFVAVGDAAPLAAGRMPRAAAVIPDPTPDAYPNLLVFDPAGRRLAIAWLAGPDLWISVYAADAGWHETARVPAPEGATRAVIAWLP